MKDLKDFIIKRLEEKKAIEFKPIYNDEMREITQEFILAGLSECGFFDNNAFMGGTAIRLFHGLDRYSKDLDFNMVKNELDFEWKESFNYLKSYVNKIGFDIVLKDEHYEKGATYRSTIVSKDISRLIDGMGIVPMNFTNKREAKDVDIKMETSCYSKMFDIEIKQMNNEQKSNIVIMDIHSLFAGKLNALFTRERKVSDGNTVPYNEERDWYDLIWYANKGVEPKYAYLSDKLKEKGPYKGKSISADTNFIIKELLTREKTLNYELLNKRLKLILNDESYMPLDNKYMINLIENIGKDGYKIKI